MNDPSFGGSWGAGYLLTGTSLAIKYYQYAQGEMSWKQFKWKAALDVAPGLVKGAAGLKVLGLGKTSLSGIEVGSDIVDHQLGVFGTLGVTDRIIDAIVY